MRSCDALIVSWRHRLVFLASEEFPSGTCALRFSLLAHVSPFLDLFRPQLKVQSFVWVVCADTTRVFVNETKQGTIERVVFEQKHCVCVCAGSVITSCNPRLSLEIEEGLKRGYSRAFAEQITTRLRHAHCIVLLRSNVCSRCLSLPHQLLAIAPNVLRVCSSLHSKTWCVVCSQQTTIMYCVLSFGFTYRNAISV